MDLLERSESGRRAAIAGPEREAACDRAIGALLYELAERGSGDDERFVGAVLARIGEADRPAGALARFAPHLIGTLLNALLVISAVLLLGHPQVRDLLALVLIGIGFVTFLFADPVAVLRNGWRAVNDDLPRWLTWSERGLGSAMAFIGIYMLGGF